MPEALRCADVTYFLLTDSLETSYLIMYWTNLHQIFRICRAYTYG